MENGCFTRAGVAARYASACPRQDRAPLREVARRAGRVLSRPACSVALVARWERQEHH
jgi:hypothetical protein